MTHLVYVFSDYGLHALPRQVFAEEFRFLCRYLGSDLLADDPDLLGEFIHCLHILQVSCSLLELIISLKLFMFINFFNDLF